MAKYALSYLVVLGIMFTTGMALLGLGIICTKVLDALEKR